MIAATLNGIGAVGIAPEAKLMGVRILDGEPTDEDEAKAFAWQPEGMTTHVSSNSWGPSDDAQTLGVLGPLTAAAIEKAATTYRNGLGTVIAVAGGNGSDEGDLSSYDGYSSNRHVIGVCSVNKLGEPSSFSEWGINIALCGIGGEFEPPDVIWTTNVTGKAANDLIVENGSKAPIDYMDNFNGTSAATPMVSAAAALILGQYPQLSARDVKEILMRSATRTGLTGGDDFVRNEDGFFFSHAFGAGLLNISGALTLAHTWNKLPAQRSTPEYVAEGEMDVEEGGPGATATSEAHRRDSSGDGRVCGKHDAAVSGRPAGWYSYRHQG